jgi:hypothetical protein
MTMRQHYVAHYVVSVAESKRDTGFQPVISKIKGKMPVSLWTNLQQLPFRNRNYVVFCCRIVLSAN